MPYELSSLGSSPPVPDFHAIRSTFPAPNSGRPSKSAGRENWALFMQKEHQKGVLVEFLEKLRKFV